MSQTIPPIKGAAPNLTRRKSRRLEGGVDLASGRAAVQRIEVNPGRDLFQQLDGLRGGVGDCGAALGAAT